MADIILSFVVEGALSNVLSRITDEIKLTWGLDNELNRLRDSSAMVRDLLQDAEGKQMENMAIRRWLKKLKLWAYDAEDLLDELEYELIRRKVETQNQEEKTESFLKFTKCIPFVHKSTFRIKMANKVKKVNESLVQIKSEAIGFGLSGIPLDRKMPEISLDQETDSIVDHPVVAREVEVSNIVNLLEDSRNQQALIVLTIVGMGGIGKTTVAKLVAQEAMEKKLFDVKMWVSVSTDFNEKQILGEMLQTLSKNAGGITNKDATLQHLSEELKGKTFLLVLDNVWNVEEGSWNRLKHRLSSVTKKNGNAVVVTTRGEEVASLMEFSPQFRNKLNLMSDDECWSIIEERVLGDSNKASISADLEAIGKEIARKCGGLPLAARVIGGTLRRNTSIEEWLAIKNNNVLNISTSVNSILRLSFDRLPFHLKPCFAFCSIYSKGADIVKIDIITQWRGQGFLDSSIKDAGEMYFNELFRSSFFLDAKYDANGNIQSARVHDLMHELALSISMLDTLTFENYSAGNDISHVQHLSIIPYEGAEEAVPTFLKDKTKTLRTLFAASVDVFYDSCTFKSLRVLRLWGENVKALPDSIGMLKHLRFLDVSFSEITELPESITKLYNLQDLWMIECKLLEKVPKRLKNLVNLRSIGFTYEKHMPSGVSCLTNLQLLPFFVIGPDRGGSIQELECLNELFDELKITNLELVRDEEEAKKANLQSKTKLEELQLVWSGEREFEEEQDSEDSNYNDQKVLEGLQPCEKLKGLVIKNYLGKKFPSWLLTMKVIGSDGYCYTLNNLTQLRLEGCRRCGEIPRVGHLPLLKKLEIDGLDNVRYLGDEFYGSDEASTRRDGKLFPSLKIFSIGSMKSLVEWKAPPTFNAFPCLEELIISECPELKCIPTSHLSSLVEFSMESCDAFDELLFDEAHPLISLRALKIGSCRNLVSFLSVEGLTSLADLWITACHKLTSLPRGLKSCSSLNELLICKCDQLASVPEGLREMHSLVDLFVIDCPNVTNFTGDILQCLTQLQFLGISSYDEALNSIHHIPSLHSVLIHGRHDFESLPYQLQSLTLIKNLFIAQFDSMEALPDWLGNLSSIEFISIDDCSNLKYLPSATAIQGLPHLKWLLIQDCPLLKESCAKGTGSEWSKISRIPKVSIDEDILQDLGT